MKNMRRTQIYIDPNNKNNKFCSSECYISFANSKISEIFLLYNSKGEKKRLEELKKERGFF